MKKILSTIFCIITSLLILVTGIAFAAIEGRLLFSGELMTYAIPWYAIFSTVTKLILALLAIAAAILPWIAKRSSYGSDLRGLVYIFCYLMIGMSVLFSFGANMGSSRGYLFAIQMILLTVVPIFHALSTLFYMLGD